MKKLLFILVAFILFNSNSVYAQASANDSFSSSVVIWAALTVSCTDMKFPDLVKGPVWVDVTSNMSAQFNGGAPGNDAQCSVAGQASQWFTVTDIDTVAMTGPGNSISFSASAVSGPDYQLNGSGAATFYIRGTMAEVFGTQVVGTYTGSATVYIEYGNAL